MTVEGESCDECGYRVVTKKKEPICCMPKSVCYGKIVEPSHKCREYKTQIVNGTRYTSEAVKVAFGLYGDNKPKCVSNLSLNTKDR